VVVEEFTARELEAARIDTARRALVDQHQRQSSIREAARLQAIDDEITRQSCMSFSGVHIYDPMVDKWDPTQIVVMSIGDRTEFLRMNPND